MRNLLLRKKTKKIEDEKIEDEKMEIEKIEDDYITNMFRRTIIKNISKKLRNKSFEKRKSKGYYI